MKKIIDIFLALLFLVSVSSFATNQFEDGYFRVIYEWTGGSVPPQWHSQYQIVIQSAGESEIVMIPGYPTMYDSLPRWRAKFSPTPEQIAALSKFADENSLYNEIWRIKPEVGPGPFAVRPIPPGSSTCKIAIGKYSNGSFRPAIVPCNRDEIIESDEERKDVLVKMINELVPKKIWDQLREQMSKFSSEAERRNQ